MKILIALHDYLPLHTGGSEVHAHQSGAELARRGHDVTALFTERDLSAQEGARREGELDGVRTIELVHQREYADVGETWREERSLARFREIVHELQPDVVHFHHLALWGSRALRAAKDAGARVVVTLHDYHLICDAATLLTPDAELCAAGLSGECTGCIRRHPLLAERWGVSGPATDELWSRVVRERFEQHRRDIASADVLIAPSRFLAEKFAQAGFFEAERAHVLKAGYPGPLREPRRRARGTPLRVGYVGGIYFSKGVHVLVRAMRHLEGEPIQLDVHGHLDWFPDYADELRSAAEGTSTRFHGPFAPERLDSVLAEHDVLVVPSVWYENMPITIQEAFRNGLPVVATELGGMAEAVENEVSGLTFPRGDERALADCLRRLAAEPELYDRLAAGRPAVPTLEAIVDAMEALYRS